jgi:cholesterol transport system auxiliary component
MMKASTMRRSLLLLPVALAACSVLPDRPYRETLRFALAPERPQHQAPRPGAPVLLVRSMRAAPGMDQRGLRSEAAGGEVTQDFWAEWSAPPAELAEEALRHWLLASGAFAAVTAPGSRLRSRLVLESELVRLQTEPAAGRAHATLSALLLDQESERDDTRILGQFLAEGTAPLPANADPAQAAAAMSEALGQALAALERQIIAALPRR